MTLLNLSESKTNRLIRNTESDRKKTPELKEYIEATLHIWYRGAGLPNKPVTGSK